MIMSGSKDFFEAVKDRRTIYTLSAETTVPKEKVIEIIQNMVKHTPSAFNSQSQRVVVLFDVNHKKLWQVTMETLRGIVPANKFGPTESKINSFANAYGTILYFDDTSVTDGFAQQFAAYKDNFPVWAQQSNGMLQYAIWTALEAVGLGVSVQHYNPLIDEQVKAQWNIPQSWKLIAQMPFGKPTAPAGEKQFVPVEERVKIF